MFEGVKCEDEIGTIIREWQRHAIHVGLDMYARKRETVHTNKAGQSAGAAAQVDTDYLTGIHHPIMPELHTWRRSGVPSVIMWAFHRRCQSNHHCRTHNCSNNKLPKVLRLT